MNISGELLSRIILEKPVAGVMYGLQKGKGSQYETIQKQIATGSDMVFEFSMKVKQAGDNFILSGPFVQGNADARFIYIDIGTYAGQKDTIWERRLKIPLTGITSKMIEESLSHHKIIKTTVPGTGKDGGPNCATVKLFKGWKVN